MTSGTRRIDVDTKNGDGVDVSTTPIDVMCPLNVSMASFRRHVPTGLRKSHWLASQFIN